MDIAQKLKDFICEHAGLSADDIANDTLLFTDGYIDSFTMASLIGFLEEELGVEVDPSDVTLENFDSIDAIVALTGKAAA